MAENNFTFKEGQVLYAKNNADFLRKYFGCIEPDDRPYKHDIGLYHIRIFMPNSKYKNIIDGDYIYEDKVGNYKYIDDYQYKTYLFFNFSEEDGFRIYNFVGQYKFGDSKDNRNIYKKTYEPFKLIPFYYPSFEEYEENGEIIREYVPYIQYDYYRTDNEESMNDLTIGMEELNMSNYIIDNMRVILMSTLNEKMKDEVDYLYLLDDLEERLYNESFENSNYIDDEHNVLVKDTSILELSKKITMHFIDVMNKNI